MKGSTSIQEDWANSVSTPKGLLSEPWRTAFRLLGSRKQVQEIQRRVAMEDYFVPATRTAAQLGLKTELGIALCFDIQVQNGGIKRSVIDSLKISAAEKTTLIRIAEGVASRAKRTYEADVRSRKMTIAQGEGVVHGMSYKLENWGLTGLPARLSVAATANGPQ